jgi:hypothetical protein
MHRRHFRFLVAILLLGAAFVLGGIDYLRLTDQSATEQVQEDLRQIKAELLRRQAEQAKK